MDATERSDPDTGAAEGAPCSPADRERLRRRVTSILALVLGAVAVALLAPHSYAPRLFVGAALSLGIAIALFGLVEVSRPGLRALGSLLVIFGIFGQLFTLVPPGSTQTSFAAPAAADLLAVGAGRPAPTAAAGAESGPADWDSLGEPPPAGEIQAIDAEACQLRVINEYAVPQHVFLDGQPLGIVAVGQTGTFDIRPGRHQVIATDSEDIEDNPVHDQFTLQRGQAYSFRVVGY